jgi:hypothetical protein
MSDRPVALRVCSSVTCPRLETNLHGLTVPLHVLSWAAVRVDLVFELPRRLQVGGSGWASCGIGQSVAGARTGIVVGRAALIR